MIHIQSVRITAPKVATALVLAAFLILNLSFSATAYTAERDYANTSGNDLEATKSTARAEIWQGIKSGTAGSATVAITDNDKVVYSEGFGMADREKNIPVDSGTIFNIGSVSKVFTAVSIMILVDDGKVDLDKPVTDYLPDFKMADKRYKDITVRMLLNHSSGLPGSSFQNTFAFEYNPDVYKDLLDTLSRSTLKCRPGEFAPYTNDGFTLAEMIVVKISGKSFGDFLQDRIFKPLGMSNSGLSLGRLQGKTNIAKFYRFDGKSEPLEVLSVLGCGGISSTPEDLCKFANSFNTGGKSLLSEKSLAEMLKIQPSEYKSEQPENIASWGLGWDFSELTPFPEKDLVVYGKNGGTGQYSSMLFTVPSKRISVALIGSGQNFNATGIALDILKAYLEEKGLAAKDETTVSSPIKGQPLPSDLLAYDGYYIHDEGTLRIALDSENDSLTVYIVDGDDESPMFSCVYSDGFFYNGANKYYFTTKSGSCYFINTVPKFNIETIYAEKLHEVEAPLNMAIPMDGKQWLIRNVKVNEDTMPLQGYVVTSHLFAALPGYVDFRGLKVVKSPVYAGMTVKSQRDLSELYLYNKDGSMWAWLTGMDYMPAELATSLKAGVNTVSIGQDGYNEWFMSDFDTILKFEKPDKSRVIVFDPKSNVLYDSIVESGDVFAPAGSFIEFNGKTGDTLKLTAIAKK